MQLLEPYLPILAASDTQELLNDLVVVGIAVLLWFAISLLSSFFVKKAGPIRSLAKQIRYVFFPAVVYYIAVRQFWGWTESGEPTRALLVAETVLASAGVVLGMGVLNVIFSPKNLRRWTGREVPGLLLDVLRYLLIVIAVAVILKIVWGEDVTPLIGALGIGGIVLGLALQETLSNFLGGLAMLGEKPFSIGDWIRVGDGREGKVDQITWRAVKLLTRDNDYMIYPNNMVSKDRVTNFNLPTRVQAVRIQVGTSYNDPPDLVKRTILEVLADSAGVLAEPRPIVYTVAYADFSINYEAKFYIDDYASRPVIQDRAMSRLWYAFRRKGIEIPFPIRTVYHKGVSLVGVGEGEARPPEEKPSRRSGRDLEATLAKAAIFGQLSPLEVQILAAGSTHLEFGLGERVIRQGEPGSALYVVAAGTARVAVRGDDGVERDVALFKTGDFFGEMSLLTGDPRTASVYSHGELEVIEVGKEALVPLLEESPALAEKLAEVVVFRREGLERLRAEEALDAARRSEVRSATTSLLGRIRTFFGL